MDSDYLVWKPIPVPFSRDVERLPAPLPAVEQIENSSNILGQRTGQTIVAVDVHFIVKFGSATAEREGQTLLFLEHRLPHLHVPRLYAMYRHGDKLYKVIERIRGQRLDDMWRDCQDMNKELIASHLRHLFSELRHLRRRDYFGAVDGGAVPHQFFASVSPDKSINGPFKFSSEFHAALVNRMDSEQRWNTTSNRISTWYRNHMPRSLSVENTSVFTHCDFQAKNVIVHDDPCDNTILQCTLIDWEEAGWYPDYWEYWAAFEACEWTNDWFEYVDKVLTPFPMEATMMSTVFKQIVF
ncbi:MAG: hypothetical protein Q9162_000937 [Coniocarpon cinnabarinum]